MIFLIFDMLYWGCFLLLSLTLIAIVLSCASLFISYIFYKSQISIELINLFLKFENFKYCTKY